jgi:hypothetical protein
VRFLILLGAVLPAVAADLTRAVVVPPPNPNAREKKVLQVLLEEIEKRSQVRWAVANTRSGDGSNAVLLERGSGAAEGYTLRIDGNRMTLRGNDERGMLFGVGRLLRVLTMSRGSVTAPDRLDIAAAPKYPLRGHQLGYRPKTNSYDGWTVAMWDQYIRDLTIWGANAIELIPPRSDDAADSPHFPLPPMRMMIEMSRIADEYGLDVWIWYPAMDRDYSDPATVEFALKEWAEVFKQLPRIDAVFVPGGDPGHTQPKHLMALLAKQTTSLRRFHPKAQMWVSPQSFDKNWMDEFLGIVGKEQPGWLAGVVFGPQIRMSLAQLREAVPKRYPIRHYPDITHSRQCQYPVPDWDPAYAATQAREVINPRPQDQARIFRLLQPYTNGFLTYSEGCNDDVNKFVWSALGWDPDADVTAVLREYSRYFIGARWADPFAQAIGALERNWRGPLLTNSGVATTLEQVRAMERGASPADLANWRFQHVLYRAYYDAYVRARLIAETASEERAVEYLRQAHRIGSLTAMNAAEEAVADPGAAPELRARLFELAEALFQSVRMQLSVERYKAISVGRGANLDTSDMPLNNRLWLAERFAAIRKLETEAERLRAIDEIVNWTNPGPGGFYDDLGKVTSQPHLVRGPGYTKDPAHLESALASFTFQPGWRSSWWDYAEALNDQPLTMRYTGLDSAASYKIRVVYSGDGIARQIRLATASGIEIHPLMAKPSPVRPVEFEIPAPATAGGELALVWTREPGLGGNGRGTQVAEVWLIRK